MIVKNKKGFTLIELLAVIVILAVIMAIATTAVLSAINSSKKKTRYLAAKEIGEMAVAYIASEKASITLNDSDLKVVASVMFGAKEEEKVECVWVDTLVKDGYVEEDATDPYTGENIGDSSSLSNQLVCVYSSSEEQDDYELQETPLEITYTVNGKEGVMTLPSSYYYYSFDGYRYIMNYFASNTGSEETYLTVFESSEEIGKIAQEYITKSGAEYTTQKVSISSNAYGASRNETVYIVEVSKLYEDGYLDSNIVNPKTGTIISQASDLDNQFVYIYSSATKQDGTDLQSYSAVIKYSYWQFDGFRYAIY